MSSFAASLALVLFVGAARADCKTPEQRAALRECIAPLRDESLPASESYRQCMEKVISVMGPEWAPTGEWDEWITKLMEDARP